MDWNQISISALPLLGVIIGGYATYFTQSRSLKEQFKREKEIEKQSRNIERLSLYSDILKLEGEHLMQKYRGGDMVDFNIKAYTENFRPIIYSKFYLLDQEVANNVRRMDSIIAEANFNEELEQEKNDDLLALFDIFIKDIETLLHKHRKQSQ